jgi:hypothetical protein
MNCASVRLDLTLLLLICGQVVLAAEVLGNDSLRGSHLASAKLSFILYVFETWVSLSEARTTVGTT